MAKVPLVNGQLMPIDFEGVQRLAQLMFSTGMLPNGCKTEPQAILLTAKAFELGVPFTQIASGLMIVNNRPTVWGDLALALVWRSPECAGVAETIDGEEWIADAGFGGSDCPPMRLAEHEVASRDGTRHRLVRDTDHGWVLDRKGNPAATDGRGDSTDWVRQYSFTTDMIAPPDLAAANLFVATLPGGRFTSNIVVSQVLPTGFASIFNRSYRRTSAKGTEATLIVSPKMLQIRLSLMFGIDLTTEEAESLWNRTA